MKEEAIRADLRNMFWESSVDYANLVEPVTFETDEEMVVKQAEWNKVKEAYDQGVNDVLEFIFKNYDVRELSLSVKLQNLREKHVYAVPIDLKKVEHEIWINKIKAAYQFINDTLCNNMDMNDKETRRWVIEKLEAKLDHKVVVQCDDENNPPDVIDQCLLIAKAMWNTEDNQLGHMYVDMIFGKPDAVARYQTQVLLDNETYNFIQKGI